MLIFSALSEDLLFAPLDTQKYAKPYFPYQTATMSHPHDQGDIQFDPNRWQKKADSVHRS